MNATPAGTPTIRALVRPPVFDGFDYFVKRSFDFVGALLLIVLISPLLLAMAIAVFLTSRGPVLYRSIRPGWSWRSCRFSRRPVERSSTTVTW